MSRNVLVWFVALSILGLFALGCSSGADITSPDVGNGEETLKDVTLDEGSSFRYIWEIGEVIIDPVAMTVDVVRPRTADFNINVVRFMQPPGGPSSVGYNINWPESTISEGYIDLVIDLTHPFPQNLYWGHDVRLVIIGNGTQAGLFDSSIRYSKTDELRMLNPDGYTRWWNMVEFLAVGNSMLEYNEGELAIGAFIASSRLNPFKYFADDVGENEYPADIAIATRGEFRSGNTNNRHMVLKFPKTSFVDFRFKYAVDASWEEPINTPVDSSDDFGLGANCNEAYQIKVDQTGSDVYWDDATEFGGDLNLNIEIFDWKQGGGSVEDEIARVVIESPTLFDNYGGYIDITTIAGTSPGSNANSIVYSYTVVDCTPDSNENQEVLVTVEDATVTTYAPPFGSFPYPNKPLAAYCLYGAEVGSGPPPPKTITVLIPNGGEEWMVSEQETIFWTSTGPIINVKIEYSDDSGATFPYTISATTPNNGNFVWDPIPDNPTDQAVIKISDVSELTINDESDADFSIIEAEKTITVVEPNGGESLEIAGSFLVEWDSTGDIANVKIEYSNDNGASYETPAITDSTPNDGSFDWDPIPDDPTTEALIKITDASDALIFDESDDVFEITDTPMNITVLVPNGGESWVVGSSHAITWSSEGAITDVMIEYYKDDDYDGTAVEIVASTENDGTFDWDPIPDDPTTTAMVRISDAADDTTYDDSDDYFTITDEAPVGWSKTIDGYALTPQPDQGANAVDICVTNLRVEPDFDSRGQVMVAGNPGPDDLTINMYSDDYTTIVETYNLWLGELFDLDLSDYNRMDFVHQYTDVIGLSNSNETSPFPSNPFNDPGHAACITPDNQAETGGAFGFWIYADADPEGDIPPDNDPDEMPWLHSLDWDSGVYGGPYADVLLDDTVIFNILSMSEHPDQPHLNATSRLFFMWTTDTFSGTSDVILDLPGMVQSGAQPGYIADSDPDIMRIAVDDNSGLAVEGLYPINFWYILDAAGNINFVSLYYHGVDEMYYYGTYGDEYMGPGGSLGIDFGGDAVDIVMMPAAHEDYAYGDWNWLCVLVDTGSGWYIKVYEVIYPHDEIEELTVNEIHTTEVTPGVPQSFDVDSWDYELHVIADDGGTHEVTVWHYEP